MTFLNVYMFFVSGLMIWHFFNGMNFKSLMNDWVLTAVLTGLYFVNGVFK